MDYNIWRIIIQLPSNPIPQPIESKEVLSIPRIVAGNRKMAKPERIEIRLLGTFEVNRTGFELRTHQWPRRKAAALLQRLAYEGRLVRDLAIEFLWPEGDSVTGANNLYRTLHALRQTLDTFLGPGTAESILSFKGGILELLEPVWVDTAEFESLCQPAPGERTGARRARLEQALALYRGELLPDERYEEWTQLPREALRRLHREATHSLADELQKAGEYPASIDLLARLLAMDPADEAAHQALMSAYARTGRRSEALRQYQVCVEALAAELDVSPSPGTVAIYEQILGGELGPEPVQIQRFASVTSPFPEDKPQPLFIGRERELAQLGSHLKSALAGEGRVVFITGEAGQGKTSLMAEFAYHAQIANPELVVAAGACQALAGIADPYLPFRELVAMLSGDWQRPWLGRDIAPIHARRLQEIAPQTIETIASHAPGLVNILFPGYTGQGTVGGMIGLQNQYQFFEQMTQLLRVLARRQPLLLLLDDLQWSDTASANLLFHLGRQLTGSEVLILGAYRPSEVSTPDAREGVGGPDSPHPMVFVVQELVRYRGDIQIDLSLAEASERRGFVEELLDSEPNRLNSTFREALYRRTLGHPLFTVELLRALQEQGDLVKDETGMWKTTQDLDWAIMPVRVEAVIARRIDRLPEELRRILEIASVEGESFTAEVQARVQDIDLRLLLQRLSGVLERRYRLVRELGEVQLGNQSLTRFQFRHNLFQQYLYNRLSTAERRVTHAEIAAVLERIGGDDLEQLAVSLAYHYLSAGNAARAVPYLYRAGINAQRRVALEEAIQFYEAALENWQENNVLAKAELFQKIGVAYLALGNSTAAIEHFSTANDLYAQAGNQVGMGANQRLIGRSYFEQGDRDLALDHYHRALSLLENEPQNPELARVISAIAQMHMTVNQYDEAIAWGERALAQARTAEIEDVIVHALTTVGTSLANKGEAERGLAMQAESQERAEALGLPHDAGRAYTGWGDSLVTLERYEEARAIYQRMLVYAQKAQTGMFEGVALVQLAYLDWWAGRWRQAWARRKAILDWMTTFPGASFVKVWASNLLGLMYNDIGQSEQARAILVEYASVARSAREPQTTVPHLGQLARCAQSWDQEAELVPEILSLTDTTAYPPYEIMPALTFACRWLAQSSGGDPSAFARLEKVHTQMKNRQSAASLHETRAFAAAIRGEWTQAIEDYRLAAELWEALDRPFDLLRTLAGWVPALDITANRAGALAVKRQAASVLEKLADELDDPELKKSFLASPLVSGILE
jgi:DNA-binding SARP family transcriptional activator